MTIGRDALDYNLKWRIRTPADSGGLVLALVTEAQLVGYDGTTTKLVRVDTSGYLPVLLKPYSTWATGELAGSASALQMPSIACQMVRFKAAYDNVGRVYIGITAVTVKDGTTDTTTGFELSAGEETGWLPADNLNRFYRISNNAGDDLTYICAVS